jgi:hypothetical protein
VRRSNHGHSFEFSVDAMVNRIQAWGISHESEFVHQIGCKYTTETHPVGLAADGLHQSASEMKSLAFASGRG